MTEEDPVFDPSLKKKKKKKKTPFDLDGVAAEESTDKPTEKADKPEDSIDDVDLDSFGGKKKKKKKKNLNLEDEDNNSNNEDDAPASNPPPADDIDLENFGKKKKKKKVKEGAFNMDDVEDALPDAQGEEEDLDLESFGKKKKKKKKTGGVDLTVDEDKENQENVLDERKIDSVSTENNKIGEVENPWIDSDRDYSYDELLSRVFLIMKDKNPEVVAGEKKKFVMRPPQVVRVGTKKTAFVNFTEIAKMLHRQPKHLSDFLSAELGTVGAVDGNNQLIMKGRFQQKHIENVLRRYIKEYVTCHTCRSPDTILNKEARLFFLQCMTCHSRCSVQTIKTGFQAVTGKRSAIRAKQ